MSTSTSDTLSPRSSPELQSCSSRCCWWKPPAASVTCWQLILIQRFKKVKWRSGAAWTRDQHVNIPQPDSSSFYPAAHTQRLDLLPLTPPTWALWPRPLRSWSRTGRLRSDQSQTSMKPESDQSWERTKLSVCFAGRRSWKDTFQLHYGKCSCWSLIRTQD